MEMWHLGTQFSSEQGNPGLMAVPNDLRDLFCLNDLMLLLSSVLSLGSRWPCSVWLLTSPCLVAPFQIQSLPCPNGVSQYCHPCCKQGVSCMWRQHPLLNQEIHWNWKKILFIHTLFVSQIYSALMRSLGSRKGWIHYKQCCIQGGISAKNLTERSSPSISVDSCMKSEPWGILHTG